MKKASTPYLAPREQQIMDIIYQNPHGVTAAHVVAALPDPLSNSSVRTMLRILESKGYVTHNDDGGRFVYLAVQPRERAAQSALAKVVTTFFGGSVTQVMATLLSEESATLTDDDLARLRAMIDAAEQKGLR